MRRLLLALAVVLVAVPAHAQLVINPTPAPACVSGQTVVFDGVNWNCQPVAATPISDASALLKNAVTASKLFKFDLSGITAGNTRTIKVPDGDVDLSVTNANRVLATGSAGAGVLSVRGLVAADIPSLDASKITTGTFANGVTTATSANTASALVARDGSGNFYAGTVYANLSGTATNATNAGNATTVTNGVYTNGSYSDPSWLTISKAKVGLGSVENTALSTWAGTANLTTLGTVATGTWNATAISWPKVDKSGSALDDIGDVTLTALAADNILKWNGSAWVNAPPQAVSAHALLGATHSDTVAGAPARGSLIVGNATPAWQSVPIGANGTVLKSNGTDSAWGTLALANLTDGANVPHTDVVNTWSVNQVISAARPELLLVSAGATAKGHVAQFADNYLALSSNLSHDGANWNRDNQNTGGALINLGNNSLAFYGVGQGANPASLTSWLSMNAATASFSGALRERGRSTGVGEWISPTFNAANFAGVGGTWTVAAGNVTTFAYTLIGKTMTLAWKIVGSTVSGTNSGFNITIPDGYVCARDTLGFAFGYTPSAMIGYGHVVAGTSYVNIGLLYGALGTGTNIALYGEMSFEVQ